MSGRRWFVDRLDGWTTTQCWAGSKTPAKARKKIADYRRNQPLGSSYWFMIREGWA